MYLVRRRARARHEKAVLRVADQPQRAALDLQRHSRECRRGVPVVEWNRGWAGLGWAGKQPFSVRSVVVVAEERPRPRRAALSLMTSIDRATTTTSAAQKDGRVRSACALPSRREEPEHTVAPPSCDGRRVVP